MPDSPELAALKAKLAASERMGSGYKARIEAIKAEIERIEKRDEDR